MRESMDVENPIITSSIHHNYDSLPWVSGCDYERVFVRWRRCLYCGCVGRELITARLINVMRSSSSRLSIQPAHDMSGVPERDVGTYGCRFVRSNRKFSQQHAAAAITNIITVIIIIITVIHLPFRSLPFPSAPLPFANRPALPFAGPAPLRRKPRLDG